MKRIVLTNNKKVKNQFAQKADVKFIEDASAAEIYEEGRKIVENGGKLLMDPTQGSIKSYFKSLAFIKGESDTPDQRSIELLSKCIDATKDEKRGKEPLLSGIMQNKEVDILKKILA